MTDAGSPRPGRAVRGSDSGRPIMALFDLAGRRWTLRVIWELAQADAPLTFRALRERCGDMSSSVLTRRMAELRDARLVERTVVGYSLSALGRGFVAAMEPLLTWSAEWAEELSDEDT